jgi:predicted nucleotide-binding protein (sugar kinase/HSP70/actin superfamily)
MKASHAKKLASKAMEAATVADQSDGAMKAKLHTAAKKVADKAKEAAREVKHLAEQHAKEVENHLKEKVAEAKKVMENDAVMHKKLKAQMKQVKPAAKKSILDLIDSDETDLITDETLNDLFDDELKGIEGLFETDPKFDQEFVDWYEQLDFDVNDLVQQELFELGDDALATLIDEELGDFLYA